jgi:catechol 2,3-dioxygenase-like lactoylglutathione lyase family enzyme
MSFDPASLSGRALTQIGLTVRNLERARGFYRDVLGLPLLFEVSGMLFFQLGGLRLMVGKERSAGQPIGGSLLYFDAPDIDELGRALEAKGVTFVSDPQVVQRTETHDLKLREFLDPDGNALAIMGLVAH